VDERVGGAAAVGPLRVSGAPRRVAAPPVRVAYCLDSMQASGGTELNAVRTAEALDRSRVALTVFAMRPDGPMRGRYEAAGVPVLATPPVSTLVAPRTAWQVWRLARLFREHGVDVVHCHDVYTNWYAGLAARLAGRPLLTSKRWVGGQRRHLQLSRVAYRLSTRVLANSRGVGRTLVEQDGVPPGRIVVVPNFVEPAAFAVMPAAELARTRREWGVPDGGPVIGCVARLRTEKGQATVLRAAARLVDRWPDLAVVLVGDGPEETALRALAEGLGLASRVCFAGHRPNRPNPHQLFDVSVLASDHEGFPNTVVEAMAAGRPVVASDVGGVPDAVVDGETGLLVPAGDVAGVASALAEVLADPALAARMGAEGRARAAAHFAVDTVTHQLEATYLALRSGASAS
jgi:glycosyltransferase involved in cell wall biosynthesis